MRIWNKSIISFRIHTSVWVLVVNLPLSCENRKFHSNEAGSDPCFVCIIVSAHDDKELYNFMKEKKEAFG